VASGPQKASGCYITLYCSGDKIEKNELGGVCSMYGGEEKCIQGFGEEIGGQETT
jgi:hypothetical protein